MSRKLRIESHIEINTKISGVTHEDPHNGVNRQLIIEKMVEPGLALELRPEPDNPYDPNAVAVWFHRRVLLAGKDWHLGYLNPSRAKQVLMLLAEGKKLTATVTEVTGGTKEKPDRGVNIVIRY